MVRLKRRGDFMSQILVIEDEERWQNQIVEFLDERNYTAICASTLEGAMTIVDERPIALVILDINLTDVVGNQDGVRFIRYLVDSGRSIPVIIISGTIPATPTEVMKEVAAFFSKQDFDPDEFLGKVSAILHERRGAL
jgi:DNA-binding response OmpR family regulator